MPNKLFEVWQSMFKHPVHVNFRSIKKSPLHYGNISTIMDPITKKGVAYAFDFIEQNINADL